MVILLHPHSQQRRYHGTCVWPAAPVLLPLTPLLRVQRECERESERERARERESARERERERETREGGREREGRREREDIIYMHVCVYLCVCVCVCICSPSHPPSLYGGLSPATTS